MVVWGRKVGEGKGENWIREGAGVVRVRVCVCEELQKSSAPNNNKAKICVKGDAASSLHSLTHSLSSSSPVSQFIPHPFQFEVTEEEMTSSDPRGGRSFKPE